MCPSQPPHCLPLRKSTKQPRATTGLSPNVAAPLGYQVRGNLWAPLLPRVPPQTLITLASNC